MQTTALALNLWISYWWITPPGQGQKDHLNVANNQVSHNTKIKSGKEIKQSNSPLPSKNVVAQHKVEQWEEEEGIETTILKKIIQCRIQ
jgi:hypothetical protein